MDAEYFETEVLPKVLANEVTCRLYLKQLEERGVTFSKPINELSHDDCISAALRIYVTLKQQESK